MVASAPALHLDEVNERQGVFHRRSILLGGFAALGMGVLGVRLTQLQLVEAQRYKTLSTSNQFNFRLVPPPRGRVVDRNGVEIAGNRPDFRVILQRDGIKGLKSKDLPAYVNRVLDRVAEIIPITPERRAQVFKDIANSPRSAAIALANDLSWDEFSRINVRAPELPGLTAEMGEARVYPFGGAFAHVIGYVAKVTADDLKKVQGEPDRLMLHPSFRIGRQGVEKALDLDLRGRPGGQKVEVDAVGRVLRADPEGDIATTPGKEIALTLDADIQNRAMEVFGTESGAAVLMDCRTGDILCLASAPSFDANQFAMGVPASMYAQLASYERKPLFNKALTATYPPGSTFKTMVALAALENGFDPKRTFTCNGVFPFGNHVFHCDQHHGTLDLHGAIVTSCDVYFYNTALFCGPDKIAEVARRFGLGQIFDIGISGQKAGLVPDTEWKRRRFKNNPANQKWFPGETPSMGIGQGYTNITPLQSCVMAARLANGRKALLPRLVRSIGGVAQPSGAAVPDLAVDKGHLDFVRASMAAVANDVRGTAFATTKLDLGPILMAGKTGTAQAHSYGGGKGAHGAVGQWDLRDHAWFMAFAPHDDPRYAISVLVEHGGFGASAAGPRARDIMKIALLKDPEVRKRIEGAAGPASPVSPSPSSTPTAGAQTL